MAGLLSFYRQLSLVWLWLALATGVSGAEPSPAAMAPVKVGEEVLTGTLVQRFEHDCLPQWGYTAKKQQYFLVIPPRKPLTPAPLLVVLHSAGGDAWWEYNTFQFKDAIQGLPEFYVLMLNGDREAGQEPQWWGGHAIRDHQEQYATAMTPAENRVLATVDWMLTHYPIDRERVYLRGISMGGSGSLGIGMRRGDLFAAIYTGVPAGVDHLMFRMGFPEAAPGPEASAAARRDYLRAVSGFGLPDAPPLLVYASQTDIWSKGQERLLRAAHDGRHALVFAWGPWGHITHYEQTDPAAEQYPWLSIRRNQAYPVFTNTSTDQHYPGHMGKGADQNGQLNAYFRWAVVRDTADQFAIELRLVQPGELSRPARLPLEATTDLTLRRLQQFGKHRHCQWRLEEGGKLLASGQVRRDEAGLLTIPRLKITAKPARLYLSPL